MRKSVKCDQGTPLDDFRSMIVAYSVVIKLTKQNYSSKGNTIVAPQLDYFALTLGGMS